MPEIAEVARITHFLRQHLVGKKITEVLAPEDANVFGKVGTSSHAFQQALTGKTVVGAGSQGKYFWILMDSPPHPVMHFGMTGWIHIRGMQTAYTRYYEKTKNDKEQWPPKFWKFHLKTEPNPESVEVAFTDARRFGRIRLIECPAADIRKHTPLVENGPDPVVDRDIFTEDFLRQKMKSRHVPIKALLLDQSTISGIGNWVGDEIMYQARLHPEQYSDTFSDGDIATLYKATCHVCDTAVSALGDSDQFPKDWLFNHRWGKGKKDSATTLPNGEKITFLTVGGRTSCIVPSRQKKTGQATVVKDEDGEAPVKPKANTSVKRARKPATPKVKAESGEETEGAITDEEKPSKRSKTNKGSAKKAAAKTVEKKANGKVNARKVSESKVSVKKEEVQPDESGRRRSSRLRKSLV